jgi:hypothetical protein
MEKRDSPTVRIVWIVPQDFQNDRTLQSGFRALLQRCDARVALLICPAIVFCSKRLADFADSSADLFIG